MTANLSRRLARIEAQEIPRATFLDVLRCLAGPIDLTADNPFVDYDPARTAPESWARINSEQGKRDLAPLAEAFNARRGGESEADRKLDDEWARKYNAWFVRYEEARRQAVEQGIEFVRPGAEPQPRPRLRSRSRFQRRSRRRPRQVAHPWAARGGRILVTLARPLAETLMAMSLQVRVRYLQARHNPITRPIRQRPRVTSLRRSFIMSVLLGSSAKPNRHRCRC